MGDIARYQEGQLPPHGTHQQCHSHLHLISLSRAYLETGVELLPRGKRVHKNGLYLPVVTRFLGNGQVTPERTPILPLDTIIPKYSVNTQGLTLARPVR